MMTDKAKLEDAVTGQTEYVLVPRVPTAEMIEAAWAYALDENAAGVWGAMIDACESAKYANRPAGENLVRKEGCSLFSETPKTDS